MNPNKPEDLRKLKLAVEASRKGIAEFRRHRNIAVEHYLGEHYGTPKTLTYNDTPVNMMALKVQIYLRLLAPKKPEVSVTSPHRRLRRHAFLLETRLDHALNEMRFHETMQRAALDSLFGQAVVKTGLDYMGGDINGINYDYGEPFAEVVDLDNQIWDMTAQPWYRCAYLGDLYRIPHEYFMESGYFENTEGVTADEKPKIDHGVDRSEMISREAAYSASGHEEQVTLIDLFLPRENLILTIPAEGDVKNLREPREWTGPEFGPYRRLTFNDVPNQVYPLPPVALWVDLHDCENRIMAKLLRQAERQKQITWYQGHATREAEMNRDARDGEYIRVDNPQSIVENRQGGIDQQNLAFWLALQNIDSWMSGNLDALGGLSAQAETLGQEEMLYERSSRVIEGMQDRVMAFMRDVIKDVGFHLFYDKMGAMNLPVRVPGSEESVLVGYDPAKIEGDYLDYNFDISVHSLTPDSPAAKLRGLMMKLQAIAPFLPFMAQTGNVIDGEALARKLDEYTNSRDLEEIITMATPDMLDQIGPVGGSHGATQAPVTRRENVRINRSAGSREGGNKALMANLLGKQVQQSEREAAVGG